MLYQQRFERVVSCFDAWARPRLDGRLATEVKLFAQVGDGVPLFGLCDLLVIDDAAREIRVVDYKTGFNYPKGKPERNYERQLQFYRLLIENSSEFAGYHVVTCENWYVEPERGANRTMHEPVVASVTDEDVAYLTRLIVAAWHRIERGDFNISAFQTSEQKLEAESKLAKHSGKVYPKTRLAELQLAFEAWLIASDVDAATE